VIKNFNRIGLELEDAVNGRTLLYPTNFLRISFYFFLIYPFLNKQENLMKLILALGMLFIMTAANAETNILFPSNRAILIIQGHNADAKMLFDSMNVPVKDEAGIQKKEIEFTSISGPAGDTVFNLRCNYSSLSSNGSCTLKVYPSNEAGVYKESKSFLIGVNDQFAASEISKNFLDLDNDNHRRIVFHSINGKFKIYKTLNSKGSVQSFTMEYSD
jgi:hypothetical protein